MPLDKDAIARFRSGWRELFGQPAADDPIYLSVSDGRRHPGMEHWVPLFHDHMETLLDYLPGASVSLDHQADEVLAARLEMIADHYAARRLVPRDGEVPYRPLPPDLLYLDRAGWDAMLAAGPLLRLQPVRQARMAPSASTAAAGPARSSSRAAAGPGANVFDQLQPRPSAGPTEGRRIVIAAWTRGSRERLANLLREHGFQDAAAGRRLGRRSAASPPAPSRWSRSASNAASSPTTSPWSANRTCWASASAARRAAASAPTSSSPRPPKSPRATSSCTRNTASAATTAWTRCTSPAPRTTACA